MSDPDIDRIVRDAREQFEKLPPEAGISPTAWNDAITASECRTFWIARRAAELARDAEKEKTAAMLRLLIDAPHQEHFCTRLNDDEMKGIDAMKEWLSAYNRDIRAGKEVGSE